MGCEETPLLLIISASFVAVESRAGGSSQIPGSQAVLDEAIKGPKSRFRRHGALGCLHQHVLCCLWGRLQDAPVQCTGVSSFARLCARGTCCHTSTPLLAPSSLWVSQPPRAPCRTLSPGCLQKPKSCVERLSSQVFVRARPVLGRQTSLLVRVELQN